MFLQWHLSLFSFQQFLVLAATLPTPLRARFSDDESLAAVSEESSYPDSESDPSSLLSCSLDMVNLKEADYNTIFDGAYGSRFENAILTLCSDEGKQIPWKKTSPFEPSILDQVAEHCCSDIMYGLETVPLESVHSDSMGFRSPASPANANWGPFFFFSAFVFCLLYIIKSTYGRRR
ncbi:hypothetical protein N7540_012687 [Penicillium herquei]|nr:hypothetical protein N7540_012687 [Penicillium herquei]